MKKTLILIILLIGFSVLGKAQIITAPKNIIKTNITSPILFNNYSFQYERVFLEKFSVSLSYRFMPKRGIPYKNQIAKFFDDYNDKDVINVLENLQIDNYAITPEFRFYLGRKRGLYASVYYRYAKFGLNGYSIDFDKYDGSKGNIKLNGDIKSNSVGIMLGKQWILARYIVLDWWIMGGHIGSAKGIIKGFSQEDLSILEQADIKQAIENFKYLDKITVTDKNNVRVNFSGNWYGIRTGFSIGVCF